LKLYLPAIGAGLIIGLLGLYNSLSHSVQKKKTESIVSNSTDSNLITQDVKNDSFKPTIESGYSNKEFLFFFERLKTLITNNDSVQIAEEMFYPLHTALEGHQGTLNIKDKKSFLKYYHLLFNERMKDFILKENLHDVFSNYKGMCLGAGRIWIDQRMVEGEVVTKVSTVSNLNDYWK
jgi:hypothetical protein